MQVSLPIITERDEGGKERWERKGGREGGREGGWRESGWKERRKKGSREG